jgi:AcrR family transcriptional regulator
VNGYEGTKIRAIATLSNANLGMLSHYWGSKRALFKEVFERRLRPVHEERMRRFRELEKSSRGGKPLNLMDVLRAQIEPGFVLPDQDRSPEDANARRQLMGRALTDPSEEVVTVMGEIFAESGNLFFSLLRKSAPNVNHIEFYWRANCAVGAFTFAESYSNRLTQFIDQDLSDIDWQAASNYVVRFIAAGMRAPGASAAAPARNGRAAPKRKKSRARAA